jgi:hypothetical protein
MSTAKQRHRRRRRAAERRRRLAIRSLIVDMCAIAKQFEPRVTDGPYVFRLDAYRYLVTAGPGYTGTLNSRGRP